MRVWTLCLLPVALAKILYATAWTQCDSVSNGVPLANITHQQSLYFPQYTKSVSVDCEINGTSPVLLNLSSLDPTRVSIHNASEGNYRYFLFANSGAICNPWPGMKFEERYQLLLTSSDGIPTTLDFQFTSVNTRPKCYNFSVYVRSENCPSGFSTASIPTAISSLSSDYGRCTAKFNDTSYCGPRLTWWTDNLVANGRGQVAWNSYWTFPSANTNNQGVWTNLGVGLGFSATSNINQAAVRVQVIDLIGLGYTTQFLDTNPRCLFAVDLQDTYNGVSTAIDYYSFQIRFSNNSTFATSFGLAVSPQPIPVPSPSTFNLNLLTTGGTLRFIEITEYSFDSQTTNGPSILSTAIHLNLNECQLSGNNGGCINRLCVDQLEAPPQCGSCTLGYEAVNATYCQKIDPCLLSNPCGVNANCSSSPPPERNKTCTCWTGYTNSSGNCTDFNECGATNGNCTAGTCFNVIGAPISTPICLPVGQNCTLAFGGGARSCNVTLPDNAANHNMTFLLTGALPGTLTLNASSMSFGPVGDPKRFTCASASIIGNMVQCIPPAGVFGSNLSLTFTVCSAGVGQCWELSFRNAGVFNHPNPQINASSIRFWGGAASTGITAPSNVGGDLVVFGGLNLVSSAFRTLPSYKVQYRVAATVYACVIQNPTALNQTVCTTVPGAGANFRFDILIDDVIVATGTDTFSYPTTPTIASVTGCPSNTATTTSECPTSSNNTVLLTITGTNFVSVGFAEVGGLNCQPMTFTNASYITCVLPQGVGLNLPVVVSSGTFLSLPAFSVSFARPVITNVLGCPTPAPGGGAADCARAGTSITIMGNNFGSVIPAVYLGSSSGPQCTNVTMTVPHTQITCVLPPVPINSDALSVVVQQFNGQVSLLPAPTVLYLKCPAGAANDVVTCDACPAGKHSGFGEICQNCSDGFVPDASSGATACTTCLAGTAAAAGALVCSSCVTGRFAGQDGASACAICPQGRFAVSSVACDYCIPGTYQASNETSCLNCTAGKFASFYGSTVCTQCQPGKYSNVEQAETCTPCTFGYVQPLSEQQTCVACPVGKQASNRGQANCDSCVRGRFAISNGTAECELCVAGFFQSDTGETTCDACPPGTQAPQDGSSLCTSCPSGTFGVYNALSGTANCTSCRAGFAQPAASQSMCEECGVGKYSAQAAATCVPCQAGSYSASAGASACSQCPLGAKPDTKLADCLCPTGTFSEPIANSSQISCSNCPAGAVCTAPGVTLANLLTAPGWWRALGSLRFYPCRFPELCLGGLGNVCEFAREGALCSVCIAGYSSNGAGKPCTVCPPQNAAWGETIGIMLLILAIIILLMVCMLAYSNMQQRALIALTKANDVKALADMQATLKEYEVGDDYFEKVRRANQLDDGDTYDEEEEAPETTEVLPTDNPLHLPPVIPHAPHAEFREGGWVSNFRATYKATMKKANVVGLLDAFVLQSTQQLKNKLRRAPNFIYKVKILLGFFQVATIMPLNGIVNWPLYWTRFISAFSFFNFDFIPWSSLSCATSISYLDKALIIGCVPIAAVLLIAVVVYVWDKSTYKYNVETQLEVQLHQRQVWRQFTKLVLFTVFLLYPFSSKVTLGVYNCVTVEGQTYVAADFTLSCSDAYYTRTAAINAIFVLLYPIGVPVACFYILYRQLHRLREPEVVLQFGFLYDAYTDDRWFWEVFDMTHKLCLTSITLFLPAKAVMPTNMCIIVLYFIGLVLANPYIRKGDDRFHLLVQVNLYLLALIGLILVTIDHPYQTELADEETMIVLLSCLLIFMNLGLFIGFFIIAGRNALKIIRSNQRAKKANVEPLPAAAADLASTQSQT